MAGLVEWWRSMPRSKQLVVAIAAFWLLYLSAGIYELAAEGGLDQPTKMTIALGFAEPSAFDMAGAVATTRETIVLGLTAGDLVVLAAFGFIFTSLGGVGVLAWRELHGGAREPGMGAGDDPLWSNGNGNGDVDMAGWSLDRI
jgi:hypothetical protein